MPNHDPDLDLVRALQAGEDSALNELITRHQAALFRFIFRFTANEEDARDLTQEVFVRAYFKINSFQPKAKFSTWLYRIATNLSRDNARSKIYKNARQTDSLNAECAEALSLGGQFPDSEKTAFEILAHREQMEELNSAINQLSLELRECLILVVLEGHSHLECAEILQTTAKTVEMRIYRARKILMEIIPKSSR